MKIKIATLMFICLITLSGCKTTSHMARQEVDGAPSQPPDLAQVTEPIPQAEPYSKYGNPPSYVALGKKYKVLDTHIGFAEEGVASWYGTKFHGRRTSSGETYDMYAMTAAHKHLPIPSYVRVTNLDNNKSTVVRVNDRGPFAHGRVIDLSYAAATKLGIVNMGTGRVKVEAVDTEAPHVKPLPPVVKEPVYVQVAAFSNPNNAKNLVSKIKTHTDKPVEIKNDSSLYRVHVGPFGSESELNAFKGLMSSLNLSNGMKILH